MYRRIIGFRRFESAKRSYGLLAVSCAIAVSVACVLKLTNFPAPFLPIALAVIGGVSINLAVWFTEHPALLYGYFRSGWIGYLAAGVFALLAQIIMYKV